MRPVLSQIYIAIRWDFPPKTPKKSRQILLLRVILEGKHIIIEHTTEVKYKITSAALLSSSSNDLTTITSALIPLGPFPTL